MDDPPLTLKADVHQELMQVISLKMTVLIAVQPHG